jgi:hypothetical protein
MPETCVLAYWSYPRLILHNAQVAIEDVFLIIRFTRNWIHYGFLAHICLCVVVAAIEGVASR